MSLSEFRRQATILLQQIMRHENTLVFTTLRKSFLTACSYGESLKKTQLSKALFVPHLARMKLIEEYVSLEEFDSLTSKLPSAVWRVKVDDVRKVFDRYSNQLEPPYMTFSGYVWCLMELYYLMIKGTEPFPPTSALNPEDERVFFSDFKVFVETFMTTFVEKATPEVFSYDLLESSIFNTVLHKVYHKIAFLWVKNVLHGDPKYTTAIDVYCDTTCVDFEAVMAFSLARGMKSDEAYKACHALDTKHDSKSVTIDFSAFTVLVIQLAFYSARHETYLTPESKLWFIEESLNEDNEDLSSMYEPLFENSPPEYVVDRVSPDTVMVGEEILVHLTSDLVSWFHAQKGDRTRIFLKLSDDVLVRGTVATPRVASFVIPPASHFFNVLAKNKSVKFSSKVVEEETLGLLTFTLAKSWVANVRVSITPWKWNNQNNVTLNVNVSSFTIPVEGPIVESLRKKFTEFSAMSKTTTFNVMKFDEWKAFAKAHNLVDKWDGLENYHYHTVMSDPALPDVYKAVAKGEIVFPMFVRMVFLIAYYQRQDLFVNPIITKEEIVRMLEEALQEPATGNLNPEASVVPILENISAKVDELMPSRVATPNSVMKNSSEVHSQIKKLVRDMSATYPTESEKVLDLLGTLDVIREEKQRLSHQRHCQEILKIRQVCRGFAETTLSVQHHFDCMLLQQVKLKEHVASLYNLCTSERQTRKEGNYVLSDLSWKAIEHSFRHLTNLVDASSHDLVSVDVEISKHMKTESLFALMNAKKIKFQEQLLQMDFNIEQIKKKIDEGVPSEPPSRDEESGTEKSQTIAEEHRPRVEASEVMNLENTIESPEAPQTETDMLQAVLLEGFQIRMQQARDKWEEEFRERTQGYRNQVEAVVNEVVEVVNAIYAMFGSRMPEKYVGAIRNSFRSCCSIVKNSDYVLGQSKIEFSNEGVQVTFMHPDASAFVRGKAPPEVTYMASTIQSALLHAIDAFPTTPDLRGVLDFAVNNVNEAVRTWEDKVRFSQAATGPAPTTNKKKGQTNAKSTGQPSTEEEFKLVVLSTLTERVVNINPGRSTNQRDKVVTVAQAVQTDVTSAPLPPPTIGLSATPPPPTTTTTKEVKEKPATEKRRKSKQGDFLFVDDSKDKMMIADLQGQIKSLQGAIVEYEELVRNLRAYKEKAEKKKQQLHRDDSVVVSRAQMIELQNRSKMVTTAMTQATNNGTGLSPTPSFAMVSPYTGGSFASIAPPPPPKETRTQEIQATCLTSDRVVQTAKVDIRNIGSFLSRDRKEKMVTSAGLDLTRMKRGKTMINIACQADMGSDPEVLRLQQQIAKIQTESGRLIRDLNTAQKFNRKLASYVRGKVHIDVLSYETEESIFGKSMGSKVVTSASLTSEGDGVAGFQLFEFPLEDGKKTATRVLYEYNPGSFFSSFMGYLQVKKGGSGIASTTINMAETSETPSSSLVYGPHPKEQPEPMEFLEAIFVCFERSEANLLGEGLVAWLQASSTATIDQLIKMMMRLDDINATCSEDNTFLLGLVTLCQGYLNVILAKKKFDGSDENEGDPDVILQHEASKAYVWYSSLTPRDQYDVRLNHHVVANSPRSAEVPSNTPSDNVSLAIAKQQCSDFIPVLVDVLERIRPGARRAAPAGPTAHILRWIHAQVQDFAGTSAWSAVTAAHDRVIRSTLSNFGCTQDELYEVSRMLLSLLLDIAVVAKERVHVFENIISKLRLSTDEAQLLMTKNLMSMSQESIRRKLLHKCCGPVIPLYTHSELKVYESLLPQVFHAQAAMDMHDRYLLTTALLSFNYAELAWLTALTPTAESTRRRNMLYQHHEVLMTAYRNGDTSQTISAEEWLTITRELTTSTLLQDMATSVKMLQDVVKEKCTMKPLRKKLAPTASPVVPTDVVEETQEDLIVTNSLTAENVFITTDVGEPLGPTSLPMLQKPQPLKLPPLPGAVAASPTHVTIIHSPRPLNHREVLELETLRTSLSQNILCSSEEDVDAQVRRMLTLEMRDCTVKRRNDRTLNSLQQTGGNVTIASERVKAKLNELVPGWEAHSSVETVIRSLSSNQVFRLLKTLRD